MNIKKYTSPIILKWIFIILISALWIKIFVESYTNGYFIWKIVVLETGELSWKLLIFTIFISLFQKISKIHFPKFKLFLRLLPLRKYSGIFAFLIILTHALAELIKRGIQTDFIAIINTVFSTSHAMIFGSISFLIMLPLFLTSTNWAIKKMGAKSWKNLQRFTHAAFIFAALHIILINYFYNGSIKIEPLISLSLYFIGYIYLFIKKKN